MVDWAAYLDGSAAKSCSYAGSARIASQCFSLTEPPTREQQRGGDARERRTTRISAGEWRTDVSYVKEFDMDLQCTAVFRRVPEGYIAFVEEFPGANTQGVSLEEARANLREAVVLVVEANRMLAREDAAGGPVIREPLTVTA